MIKIDLADEFSPHPAGRYRSDGLYSGQRFREEYLEPALRDGESVTVVLDGTRSLGSSFLDEAFGGLVRESGIEKAVVESRLRITADATHYKTYIRRAEQYISASNPTAS